MHHDGCGPEWIPKVIKDALFNWFFEASCHKHDAGYAEGGDESRRKICDRNFWLAMRRDALRYEGITRLLAWTLAIVYYVLVRTLGWTAFNYK